MVMRTAWSASGVAGEEIVQFLRWVSPHIPDLPLTHVSSRNHLRFGLHPWLEGRGQAVGLRINANAGVSKKRDLVYEAI